MAVFRLEKPEHVDVARAAPGVLAVFTGAAEGVPPELVWLAEADSVAALLLSVQTRLVVPAPVPPVAANVMLRVCVVLIRPSGMNRPMPGVGATAEIVGPM